MAKEPSLLKGLTSNRVQMAQRAIYPPTPIFANHSDGRTMTFKSASIAARWMMQNYPDNGMKLDASSILRKARRNLSIEGWSLQLGNGEVVQQEAIDINPLSFVFGPDAADIFRGKSVRVTQDRKVSVYDVIKIVTNCGNPRDAYASLCAMHAEVVGKTDNYQFTGTGQRSTPVTDAEGLMYIINLLPGDNAARFRAGGAKLLVRFLGGDETLIPEVMAIKEAHASGATNGSVAGMCADAIECGQLQPPAMLLHKWAFLSPTMIGKDLHDYDGKEACYLLTFIQDNISYIKFGRSTNLHNRLTEHMREIPGMQIWFVLDTPHARKLEDMFKKKMKYKGHLQDVMVRGKKQTEILVGIGAQEAETILTQMLEIRRNRKSLQRSLRGRHQYPGLL
jgi:hypothetical protein